MKRRQFIKDSAITGMALASPTLVKASAMFSQNSFREVHRILHAGSTMVGTLPIMRAFAGDHTDYVSPYVLFDEFGPVNLKAGSDPLRVDAHPHAGVIPTTYFLAGSGHHKDSLNYDFQVGVGEFMMFSSGKGAIHMEETGQKLYDEGGQYHGFQIWLNMPSAYKHIDPATYVYRQEHMPTIEHELYTARIILGELFGTKSEVELLSPAFYYHIQMKEGCRMDIPTEAMDNAFIYVIKGELEIEGKNKLESNHIALYKRGKNLINIYAKEKSEILVMGGRPLNEPVYSYGPFVMNTEEQIRRCFADYQAGRMGDPDVVNR